MSEKPILFKPELVRAILDGKKTETRRIIKPQPTLLEVSNTPLNEQPFAWKKEYGKNLKEIAQLSPYGKVGDILWVRETWSEVGSQVYYKADYPSFSLKWKPSIHMPRKYCRLRLKIKDIRVERIQDIRGDDILAEGIDVDYPHKAELPGLYGKALKNKWRETWDAINAKRGFPWKDNCWVWKIVFEVVK